MPSRTDIHRDEERGRSWGQRQRPATPMTPTEARQGSYGRPVLIVLLGGILLAMVLWIPVEWWGNSVAPENPANEPPATVSPSPAENNTGAAVPQGADPTGTPTPTY